MAKNNKISDKIQCVTINNPKMPSELKWVNISNAGKKEIEYLRKEFNFNLPHLHASLAKTVVQLPMVTSGENYIFMVLHFPIAVGENIVPAEIDFFIGPSYIITLHRGNIGHLNDFYNLFKKDGDSFLAFEYESSFILLYEILEKLMTSCYSLLDKTAARIENVEDYIFEQEQIKAVSEILYLRRNMVNMRKILRTHKNNMKKLVNMANDIGLETDIKIHKYYNKLIEHTKNIWENLENYQEMINILNNTNESMQNDKISNIMKTLTVISVIVFPLTLFAAIFGMNTVASMPFVDSPYGFWIIVGIMVMCSLFMLFIFERKKWL